MAARFGKNDRTICLSTFAQSNPHAHRDAKGLAALGAIELIESDDGLSVSFTDANLIGIWARMRESGFEESTNFSTEELDHYTRSADYLAYAEATRFVARTEGIVDEERAADMLKTGLPLMLDFFGNLRMKFFMHYLALGNRGGLDSLEAPNLARPARTSPEMNLARRGKACQVGDVRLRPPCGGEVAQVLERELGLVAAGGNAVLLLQLAEHSLNTVAVRATLIVEIKWRFTSELREGHSLHHLGSFDVRHRIDGISI